MRQAFILCTACAALLVAGPLGCEDKPETSSSDSKKAKKKPSGPYAKVKLTDEADFDDDAEKEIDEDNVEAKVDELEKEIDEAEGGGSGTE